MATASISSQFPPAITFSELFRFIKNPIKQIHELVYQYPDAMRFPLRTMPTFLVQNPEYAKRILQENYKNYTKGQKYGILKPMLGNGLLLSEGDFWKKQRLLTQPAFHRKRLELVAELAADASENLMSRWQHGQTIDFTNEMGYLTIEIVSRALFGADVGGRVDDIRSSINKLNRTASLLARIPVSRSDWVMHIPFSSGVKNAMKVLDDTIYGIIEERRCSGGTYDDLLNMLMEAKYEDTGESMTDLQLRDELITLFIAGHETTVISLSWTAYLLSQHPEAVEKIRAELNETIGERNVQFGELPRLKYLTNVVNEAMRLYPPIFIIGRRAIEDDVIGQYKVPANYNVAVNIYGMHRHPDYWEKPDAFIPERFEGFDLKGDNRFLFLPFGGGPRTCIGNNFAMMEMLIIVSMMVQRFDFQLVSEKPVEQAQFTLRPKPSVSLKLLSRVE